MNHSDEDDDMEFSSRSVDGSSQKGICALVRVAIYADCLVFKLLDGFLWWQLK